MRELKVTTWWNRYGPSDFVEIYCLHNALTHGYHTWGEYVIKYDEDRDEYGLARGSYCVWLDGPKRVEMLIRVQQDYGVVDTDMDAYWDDQHEAYKESMGDHYQPIAKPEGIPND